MNGDNTPLWLIILSSISFIFGFIGMFWSRIKSSVELKIQGGQVIAEKRLENEFAEIAALKKRVEILEKQNIRLVKSNTAYATTMMMIIDQYEKANPDQVTVISNMKHLIRDTLQ